MSAVEEIKKPETRRQRDPYEVLGARPDPEGIFLVQKGLVGSRATKLLNELKKSD